MPPIDEIILAPAAKENGLACMIAELVQENLRERPAKRRDLAALDGRIGIVARDADVALTLDFRRGALVIYDGLLPARDLTISTDSEKITGLTLLGVRYGLPVLHDETGQAFVRDLVGGQIRVEGLTRHPILLVRLARLLSVQG